MPALKTILSLTLLGLLNLSTAAPDSAGIVEMVNGLAYGGIPYGSVTGMVAKYPGLRREQIGVLPYGQLNSFKAPQPVGLVSNFQGGQVVGVQPQTLQFYNVPGVVPSNVLSSISHIGY